LQIDDELELARAQDRQLRGLLAFENACSVDAGETIPLGIARSVAHEAARIDELAGGIDHGHPMVCRERDELYPALDEPQVGSDHECVGSLFSKAGKGRIDLAIGAGGESFDLPPNGRGCRLQFFHIALSSARIARIDERGETCGVRYQLVQEAKLLACKLPAH
jgi:hypothetical protein